ncbi:hypothetical protein FB567DRAFT_510345 [Paraphoma chrysanthemicola]|uniref:Uncharacterized protein n=1 Tax=Paraphoma chrysanthemicola TaxID=798071 RepID=A0A8K0RFR5_9PLEO|nr:hypothetical protein FB567DRAFT_510345 [Paraphoma chrysanthemicola]
MSSTATTPTHKKKILMTGLDVNANIPEYFRTLYGTPAEIKANIDADEKRVTEAGYDVTVYFFDDQDPQKGLDWFEAKLKEVHFDGIMIGVGLRLIPEQTALYEKVVNVARRLSPDSVFLFNEGPGMNYAAVQRNKDSL